MIQCLLNYPIEKIKLWVDFIRKLNAKAGSQKNQNLNGNTGLSFLKL